jgi:UDP-N-acetylmuramyl pentapeptide phosphotransferase/UDP-N-acetylglucosamine-1-phosphate transferase
MEAKMSTLIASFIASFLAGLLLLRFRHLHEHLSADHDTRGVQKFHVKVVPRIGGIALLLGILAAIGTHYVANPTVWWFAALLLLSALPVFAMGLLEDLTKSVSVRARFLAAIVSALLAGFVFDAWLVDVQFIGLDTLLAIPVISILFTCFAVAGVTNAFNIIDGYHGLVSIVACIILAAIAYVAFKVQDFAVMASALAAIGAVLGFAVWNYPRGLIFLGDGGAYLLGFWVAELSILLVTRNVSISKWFPVLICIYPIFETMFTMYRRFVLKKSHVGKPDAIHLHQLIYRRVVRWAVGSDDAYLRNQRNSLTAPYLWVLASFSVIPAMLFWQNKWALQFFIVLFALTYLWLYLRIIQLRVPKWLLLNDKSS